MFLKIGFLHLPNPQRAAAFFLSLMGVVPGPRHSAVSMEGTGTVPRLIRSSQTAEHLSLPVIFSFAFSVPPSPRPPEQ